MEGRLGRCRGILGALFPTFYWFKLDDTTATLYYALTKDTIHQPLKEIDLTYASVQQRSDRIYITTFQGGSFKLKAQNNAEACSWASKLNHVIQDQANRMRIPDGKEEEQTIVEENENKKLADNSPVNEQVESMEKWQWTKDGEKKLSSPTSKGEPHVSLHNDFVRQQSKEEWQRRYSSSLWTPVSMQRLKQYIVAIDFGTTYSGYAYLSMNDHVRFPASGHSERWKGNNALSEKTPTCLLLNKDGEFEAFGYEAETTYLDLVDEKTEEGWKFFKQFKMKIYQRNDLTCNFEIKDDQGNPMPADTIFGLSLEYMKRRAIAQIHKSDPNVSEECIFYVITVPAIWSESSRQFMMNAINVAGMDMDQAILAKEPEAAAIYCKEKQLEVQQANKRNDLIKEFRFEEGSKFVVLDLGGGTTDIAVHKVIENGRMKLMRSASGGPWGGTSPDVEFVSLIMEIIGKRSYDDILRLDRGGYYDLSQAWEVNKRKEVREDKESSNVIVTLPSAFQPLKGEGVYHTSKGKVSVSKGGKLRIPYETFKSLFDATVHQIVNHLKTMSKEGAFEDANVMFMVGGFSDNRFVQEAVQSSFLDMRVIVPSSPSLAVLHGAIAYGFQPQSIDTRVSSCHYGIEENGKFIPLINIHQEIPLRSIVSSYTTMLVSEKDGFHVKIYASDEKLPPNEIHNCRKLGNITIRMTAQSRRMEREIKISIYFDHTEMKVKATDVSTGREFYTTCDFLEHDHTKL